ncbi:MAG: hypothetical protein ACTH9H_06225 [Galactobacter sp.]
MTLAGLGLLNEFVKLPPAVGLTLAIISIALLVVEVRKHRQEVSRMEISQRGFDDYADVENATKDVDGQEFMRVTNGHVVMDYGVSKAIANDAVDAEIGTTSYVAPPEIRDLGAAYRRQRLTQGATYNGHVLGLNSDARRADGSVKNAWTTEPARYWDHLGSDIMATQDVLIGGELAPYSGRSLYIDRTGNPRDFGSSWLLNGMGTSVLAITSDHKFVLVQQSPKNESSKGLIAPSGSGSLEIRDYRGNSSLPVSQLTANGAFRELSEETGILESEISDYAFLGFARWLEKAAKPELLCLALLTVSSDEVRRRPVPAADKQYTKGRSFIRIPETVGDWNYENVLENFAKSSMAINASRISVPLELSLRFACEAAADLESSAGALVRSLLVNPS